MSMLELITPDSPEQQQAMDTYRPLARPAARALLRPHIVEGGRMVYMPFDPEKPEEFDFPFQDPEAYLVKTPRMPVETANEWAGKADLRFDDMIEMAGEGQEAQEIIQESGEIVENGGFIWIVTRHIDDLTDIAYAGHITTNQLVAQNRPEYIPKKTLIVLSMAISEGAYTMDLDGSDKPVEAPMMGVVQTGYTDTVRTWPKTDSAIEIVSELPEFARDEYINGNALRVTENAVEEGYGTGSMGPTGSTNPGATVNRKTLKMLSLPNAYVLGMTVWRQTDTPVVRYAGRPVKIDPGNAKQFDAFLGDLTDDMNEHIPGANFR